MWACPLLAGLDVTDDRCQRVDVMLQKTEEQGAMPFKCLISATELQMHVADS